MKPNISASVNAQIKLIPLRNSFSFKWQSNISMLGISISLTFIR